MPEFPNSQAFPNSPHAPIDSLSLSFDEVKANFTKAVIRRLDLQSLEWLYWIPLCVVVPAGAGFDTQIDIKSDAHFKCEYITGDYTTLNVAGADDGTNHITVRISDGSNDLKLMNSAVPLDLFCSPGRVLMPATAGNPSNSLFYPFPFQHIFSANGGIVTEFQNTGATDNVVHLLFVGKKLRSR